MTMGRNKTTKIHVQHKTKLKKDPGVPRLPDLKVRKAEKERAQPRPFHARLDPDSVMAEEPTLSTLAMLAESSSAQAQDTPEQDDSLYSTNGKTKEQLRRHYLRTLHKVIDESDIIVLVLDARDPEGCRSRLVEEEVRRREADGKRLVFVLNKIDLVPRSNAQSWLKYLRHSTPTLPFLSPSSAQHQRNNISSSTAPALLKLLKAYKPKARSVTVGVVGYPNVGKSSLINALKRSKVCAVAAQAGHTKDLQSVQLERGMRIIDSPGVIFDDDDAAVDGKSQKKGNVLLRNVVKVEDVDDPIVVVEEIVSRTPLETMQKIYNLPEYTSTLEFLTMLSLNTGRLLKGGTPDILGAARQVLSDWNHQKIPYFSEPPSVHPSLIPSVVPNANSSSTDAPQVIAPGAENVGQAQILTSLSKPFTLEGLFGAADAGAFGGEGGTDVNMADEDGDVFFDAEEGMDEDGIAMDADDPNVTPRNPRKRSRSPSVAPSITDMAVTPDATAQLQQPPSRAQADERQPRQPKRQRRAKDVPDYHAPPDAHVLKHMSKSNPLNRRNLKREAKRARKANRPKAGVEDGAGGGMEVDDGLEFTFMA
ncbi:hypothetical protein HGRIS_010560 [Hohenbuehelia grisea]|uniref:CP-type G domain-containing protein n=1 Tax=Hohenbuehelia grisea TaxID=104357 RepID=A0ABR3IX35_9AGAR